jgi:hypothetical protein
MDPIGRAVATVLDLPSDVHAVLAGFVTCEVATLGRDGTPLAWPAVPLLLPERGQVLLTTTIGFPAKAANLRRDPRVSLLYSNPTGSGLESPPSVLVQGTATVSDSVGDLRVFLAARRRAGRYLAVRGLPRPQVPWWRLRSSS